MVRPGLLTPFDDREGGSKMTIFENHDREGDGHIVDRALSKKARFDKLAALPITPAHEEAPTAEESPWNERHVAGRPEGCDPDAHAAWLRHAHLLRTGTNESPLTFRGDEARTFITALYQDLLDQGWTLKDLDLDGIYADAVAEADHYRVRENEAV